MAIIETNDGIIYWLGRIYASLGLGDYFGRLPPEVTS